MIPTEFPQSNTQFQHPPGYSEEQIATIAAFVGEVRGGNLDGSKVSIVAWKPSPEEIKLIEAGNPVFIGFLAGVPPHFVTAQFPGV